MSKSPSYSVAFRSEMLTVLQVRLAFLRSHALSEAFLTILFVGRSVFPNTLSKKV